MNILHVNTNDTGGAAIAAIRLHYLLLQNGENSKILFLKRTGNTAIKEAYYFEDLFSNKTIFNLIFKLNSIYNRRFTFYKPQVYFNGLDSLFNIARHPLFKWANVIHFHWVVKFLDWQKVFKHSTKKYVWTCHDMNPFTGGNHYETGYNNEFNTIAKSNIKRKAEAIKNIDITMIGPSEWITDLIAQSAIFKHKKALTIRNPIDTNVFKIIDSHELKTKWNIEQDKKVILFVAENPDDERKGFNLLLNALNKIEDKINIHLLIIGKKIELNTTLPYTQLGTISDEELMYQIYNAADVFVIPSIEDNLPNTVSEALLCGTPVVGFNVGGIPEMVVDGKSGLICKDYELLHEAISHVLNLNLNEVRNYALLELDNDKLYKAFVRIYN